MSPPASHERIFSVPDEIWIKILTYLEPLDVLALGRSCRRLNKFVDRYFVFHVTHVSRFHDIVTQCGGGSG